MPTPTTTYSLSKPTVGGDDNTWGTEINNNLDKLDDLLDGTLSITPNLATGWEVGGVAVTSTAAELNILDGVTASTAEINLLDGVTWTLLNYNTLTASAAELNILDGVTATTAELNYVDGVTSNIQTQLDAKAANTTQVQATWEAGTGTTETIVSPAKVKAAIDALVPQGIGVGQTWQDFASSGRAVGTSYQNTTGKPIFVSIAGGWNGVDATPFEVSNNGSTWININNIHSGGTSYGSAVIPNGGYYRWNGGTITSWAELR
jgi:hypothetical protein